MPEIGISEQELDAIANAFENQWLSHGHATIVEFLNSKDEPDRKLLCELIRLDLEFRWRKGSGPRVENYLEEFEHCEFSTEEITSLAFEEYRVRFQNGDVVVPGEYESRLNIDSSRWPTWQTEQRPFESGNDRKRSTNRPRNSRLLMPSVGNCFHGFELVGTLGTGAFGSVFLARETELSNRLVALKVTEKSDLEPQSLARLQHTNIIPIYSLKKDDDLQSICMPFMGVATLRDLMSQARNELSNSNAVGKELISTVAGKRASTVVETMPTERSDEICQELSLESWDAGKPSEIDDFGYRKTILWMVAQIADGLSYAHGRGIIHGDLKPANVLISDDGHPLILDFHLSKTSGQKKTDGSLVGGTIPYMSSHHLKSLISDAVVDEDCDIFSLGVVLYDALTGQLPYESFIGDDDGIREMIELRKSPPTPIRAHDPTISIDVESIVSHCFGEAMNRYRSTAELQQDIRRHLADLPLKTAPNRSLLERSAKWIRRHPRLSSGTTITALAGCVFLIMVAFFVARNSKLKSAALENDSRRFVESLIVTREPVTSRHEDYQIATDAIQSLDAALKLRSQNDPDNYLQTLSSLPVSLRQQEIDEVAYSKYWIAYRQLQQSAAASEEVRDQIIDSALTNVSFAEELKKEHPSLALLQLKHELLQRRGNVEESRELEERLETLGSVETHYDLMLQGVDFFRQQKHEESLVALEKLLVELQDFTTSESKAFKHRTWLLMGQNYERLGDFDKSELCYSTSVRLQPKNRWGYIYRGINYLNHKKFQLAANDFERAIELQSIDPMTYLNRALCQIGLRKFQLALHDLDYAIEQGVEQTRAHYLRYQVLKQLGEKEKAELELEKFLQLEPTDEKSWLSRGMARIATEQPRLALDDFRSALLSNANSTNAFQNIATVQSELLGETESAIEAMSRIVELEPENLVARVTRGVLFARIKKIAEAHADAEHVLRANNSADMYFRAAGIFSLTSTLNDRDAVVAVDLLKKAAFKDARLVSHRIQSDSDLDPIRDRPDFAKLVQTLSELSGKKK